jgi:hypothetical protein
MPQTRIRIAEQLQTSAAARSILITDASSKPAYFAPSTGANRILYWDDTNSQWANLSIGTNLSITSGQLNASAGAGGYSEIQEEGAALTARTKINFIGTGITATDNAGNTRTDVTLATKLNNLVNATGAGILVQDGSNNISSRTITGTTDRITVTNGNGANNPAIDIASTYVGQSSITTLGTITTGTWNGTAVTTAYGGTGVTSVALGDLLYGFNTGQWTKLTLGSEGLILRSTTTGPAWQTLASTSLSDTANIAYVNTTETITAVWTYNSLPESSVVPTSANQLTNKSYVDTLFQGVRDYKESVRVASAGAVTVTYSATGGTSARGQITAAPNTLNGVTLSNGNRILLKNQASGAQNGIWVVTTAGSGSNGIWDRATDFDTDTEVTSGLMVYVSEATTTDNRGTYLLSTPDPIIVGGASGTALTFVQISSVATVEAGAGLTQTGLTINVVAADDSLTVAPDALSVRLASTGGLQVTSSSGINIKSDTVTADTIGITTTTNGAGIKYNTSIFDESAAETLSIKTAGLTYAMLPTVTAGRLLGRGSASGGTIQELTTGSGLTISGTVLQHSSTGASTVTHSGSSVPATVTIDSNGHVTGFTTRTLNLSDLGTVSITSPTSTQVLTYNGSNWVNQSAQGGTTTRAFVEGSTLSTVDLDANTGVVKDVNGNNVAFTIPSDTNKFFVYRNGVRQMESGGTPGDTARDYSVNTGTHVITLSYALTADEVLMVEKLN